MEIFICLDACAVSSLENGMFFRRLTVPMGRAALPEIPLPICILLLIRLLIFLFVKQFLSFGTGIAAPGLDGNGPVFWNGRTGTIAIQHFYLRHRHVRDDKC